MRSSAGVRKFQKKRRKIRSGLIVPLLLLLILGISMSWGVNILVYSRMASVRSLEVIGTRWIGDRLLASVLSEDIKDKKTLFSHLGPSSIFFWKNGEYEISKNKAPYLDKVSLIVDISSGRVVINAIEKDIALVWCYVSDKKVNERCYGVDKSGIAFVKTPSVKGNLIIKVNDLNNKSSVIGLPVLPKNEWDNFMDMINSVWGTQFHPKEIEVRDYSLREWSMSMAGGTKIFLNIDTTQDDLEKVLNEFSNVIGLDSVDSIDLRVKGKLYYK